MLLLAYAFLYGLLSAASAYQLQAPLSLPAKNLLITPETHAFVNKLIADWNSTGLSVAVVRQDPSVPGGWRREFGSYGIANGNGSPVTPDTMYAIASNSKLFLALSVGLIISNDSLVDARGERIDWTTKARALIPEWGLMDEDMHRGVNIQDMLSHRTGMPRHDLSGMVRDGGVPEMISTLRYLRPSAEFRQTFQYNNLMYETLSYLPSLLLNQSYESYIHEHIFAPLSMTSSTYSVAEAEQSGHMADGFHRDMRDRTMGKNGTLTATVPYFQRPGEESIWAGAGGVLSSARDLATWVSMLLNEGRHPTTNETVIPAHVVDHVAQGLTVSAPKASYPELSPKVYGCGQWRYTYQGHEIIEHGGHNPGFLTQVARFPNDNLGLVLLSNDEDAYGLYDAVKWRIVEDVLSLPHIDWDSRFRKENADSVTEAKRKTVSRPKTPQPPSSPFTDMQGTFSHPTYGSFSPCYVQDPSTLLSARCQSLLEHPVSQRLLTEINDTVPTLLVPFKRTFTTHILLRHFDRNLFNASMIWSNYDVRRAEGHTGAEGDLLVGMDERFEVEWVEDSVGLGWAFKGNFWGKQGNDAKSPGGVGRSSAEVWFDLVDNL